MRLSAGCWGPGSRGLAETTPLTTPKPLTPVSTALGSLGFGAGLLLMSQASEEALLCGRTLGLGPVLCHLEPCVAGHPGFCSHLAWPSPLGPSTASRHHPCTLAPGLPVPWLAFRAGLGELLLARPASDPQLQALPFGEPYTPSFLGGPGLLRGPLCNFVNPRLVG